MTHSHLSWPPFIAPPATASSVLHGLEAMEKWSAVDTARGQHAQLAVLLDWAVGHVPHYVDSDRFLKAAREMRRRPEGFWDIWRALPVLTKAELRADGSRMNAAEVPAAHLPLNKLITSGSTGIPVEIGSTAVTRLIWSALTLREMRWNRRDFRRRLGAIRYLAKGDRDPEGHIAPSWPRLFADLHSTGPFAIIHVGLPIDALARWLRGFDPHYLIAHPSVVAALLDEFGEDRPPALEEILFVAEPVPPSLEARLMEQWNVRCSEYYSANETGYIAFRCAEYGKLHVQSEFLLVEVLDEEGNPCGTGETGRLVATPLHNLATPVLRYDIGDLVKVGEPCRCGRNSPVIDQVLGRVRNLVQTPDGRRYWPIELGKFRSIPAVRQFQYVQNDIDNVDLRLVINRPLSEDERGQIVDLAKDALGYPFHITVTVVPAIARGPTGKYEEFLSLVSPA